MTHAGLMNTSAFAKLAGVTVRTLRYYDRLGLLHPAKTTTAGHRLYRADDLVRLQQVMTLKFIGFSLQEITRILDDPHYNLAHALVAQRQIAAEKSRQMRTIIRAIDEALGALAHNSLDMATFAGIIKALHMEHGHDWTKKYYTEEQQAALAERAKDYTPEQQAADAAEWQALIAEAKQLAADGADPAGDAVQALAVKWQAMIDRFTRGDAGIEHGLQNMYADRENIPDEYRWGDEQLFKFIGAMMAAYKANK